MAKVLVCFLMLLVGGCSFGPSLPKLPSLADENASLRARLRQVTGSAEVAWGSAAESETFAAHKNIEADNAKSEAAKSRANGRRLLNWAAIAVAIASAATFFLSLPGLIFGVGRTTAITGVVVSMGGLWLAYFIMVHGFFVSEAISWGMLGVILVVLPIVGIRWLVLRWRNASVAALLSGEKTPIDLVPASAKTRAKLSTALKQVNAGVAGAQSEAAKLLRKHKLLVPGARS